MSTTASIESIVQEIVRARVSAAVAGGAFPVDIPLGAEGLGLDSIAVAEVLLDCEHRFGVSIVSLLEGPPLTLIRLTTHLAQSLEMNQPT